MTHPEREKCCAEYRANHGFCPVHDKSEAWKSPNTVQEEWEQNPILEWECNAPNTSTCNCPTSDQVKQFIHILTQSVARSAENKGRDDERARLYEHLLDTEARMSSMKNLGQGDYTDGYFNAIDDVANMVAPDSNV